MGIEWSGLDGFKENLERRAREIADLGAATLLAKMAREQGLGTADQIQLRMVDDDGEPDDASLVDEQRAHELANEIIASYAREPGDSIVIGGFGDFDIDQQVVSFERSGVDTWARWVSEGAMGGQLGTIQRSGPGQYKVSNVSDRADLEDLTWAQALAAAIL